MSVPLSLCTRQRGRSFSILSTLHQTVLTGTEGKRKPETITFYNTTNVGVDSLDQMARASIQQKVRQGGGPWQFSATSWIWLQ
ncbi:unnamed protein product [Knipowitschia caucasica]